MNLHKRTLLVVCALVAAPIVMMTPARAATASQDCRDDVAVASAAIQLLPEEDRTLANAFTIIHNDANEGTFPEIGLGTDFDGDAVTICGSSPATGNTVASIQVLDINVPLLSGYGGGNHETSEMRAAVELASPVAGMVVTAPAGVGTGFGTVGPVPIPFASALVSVACGKVSADFCYNGVCIQAGSTIACRGTAWGRTYVTLLVAVQFDGESTSVYPCSTFPDGTVQSIINLLPELLPND